jgi:hypothetical protein
VEHERTGVLHLGVEGGYVVAQPLKLCGRLTVGVIDREQKPGLWSSSPGLAERTEPMWHAVEAPA